MCNNNLMYSKENCCKKQCFCHCWHSTHEGPWYGVNPPPIRCCFCGIYYSELHGPYQSHYTNYSSDIKITINPSTTFCFV